MQKYSMDFLKRQEILPHLAFLLIVIGILQEADLFLAEYARNTVLQNQE